MSAADPYGLLGVDPDATDADIRHAFRRLARRSHPDAGGDPARFVALRSAHDLLTDPVARARFDATRAHAPAGDPGPAAGAGVASGRTGADASASGDDRIEAAAVRARWPGFDVVWRLDARWLAPLDGGGAVEAGAPPESGAGFVAVRGGGAVQGSAIATGPPEVVAVDAADGALRWRAGLATPSVAGPALIGGLVVVASVDGVVHGLDCRDGSTRWERRLTTLPTGLVQHEGMVVVVAPDSLTAVGVSGEVRWVARPHGGVGDVLAAGPVVVMHTGANAVVGLDSRSGATRWWLRSATPWGHLPVVAGSLLWLPEATVDADSGGRLVGVDPRTGGAVQSLQCPAAVVSVHEVDGVLVVRDVEGGLTAVRHGRPLWRMVVPATPSAPLGVDDAVAVATADGVLRFLSARHGTELHQVGLEEVGLDAPDAGPASLLLVGDLVVVTHVSGGVVAHRVLRPAEGPSPR